MIEINSTRSNRYETISFFSFVALSISKEHIRNQQDRTACDGLLLKQRSINFQDNV